MQNNILWKSNAPKRGSEKKQEDWYKKFDSKSKFDRKVIILKKILFMFVLRTNGSIK